MYVQNRPVASTTPRAVAQPIGGAAPQPTTIAVDNYQPASAPMVQTASTGQVSIMATLGSMLSGLIGFVKNLFGKLFHSTATPTTSGVPTATSTGSPGTTTDPSADAALAAQYGLLNTPQNLAAFRQVQATEQADATVVGPGSTNTESVTELQQLLGSWGYQVPVTGQFDQATANAVMSFKTANGLTESFTFANGQPGVTPYVDQRCKNAMIALLQNNPTPGSTGTAPTTSSTAATPASTTPVATVTTPAAPAPTPSVPAPTTPTATVTTPTATVTTPVAPTVTTPVAPTAPDPTVTTPVAPATPTPTVTTPVATPATPTPAPAPAPTPVTVSVTPPTSTTPVATPAPTTTSTSALTADQQATCQQEGILATPANYQAFMNDAQAIESQNALGPGSTDTQSITELQQVLAGWGYAVTVNGQFDQATTDAVLQFKQASGLQASYVLADGSPAYNPFIDTACKQAMIAKLGG